MRRISCEISFLVTATEDLSKIIEGISETLEIPTSYINKRLKVTSLKGHFGYPIEYVKVPLSGDVAVRLIKSIVRRMSEVDRYFLTNDIDDYLDLKGRLYLRLDKQRLCLGRVNLSDKDPVRIVIKWEREKIIEIIRSATEE